MTPPLITDERIWEMWREANNVHTVEVDMAFARMIEEEAVRLEREAILEAIGTAENYYPGDDWSAGYASATKKAAEAIRARSSQVEQG